MAKERITYLDSLKGLLIILVMIGHSIEWASGTSHELRVLHNAIYAFHMPAFFMLSGMFVKPLGGGLTKRMVLKYAKAYLIPFAVVSIFILFAALGYNYLFYPKQIQIKWVGLLSGAMFSGSAIWFLLALFFGLIIYRILCSKLQGMTLFLVVLFIFILATILPIHFLDIREGLSVILYIYIGNMLRTYWSNVCKASNSYITFIIIFFLFLYLVKNGSLSVFGLYYPLGLTSVACSVLISSFIICKSKLIDCRFLNHFGKHTLLILCIHTIFCEFFYTDITLMVISIVATLVIVYIVTEIRGYITAKSKA